MVLTQKSTKLTRKKYEFVRLMNNSYYKEIENIRHSNLCCCKNSTYIAITWMLIEIKCNILGEKKK